MLHRAAGDRAAKNDRRALCARCESEPWSTGSPTVGNASRFTTFCLIPKFVHFSERRLLGRFSGRGQRLLDVAEAALELFVCGAQRSLRIGAEMAGEVDGGEQEIADLLPGRA